MFPYIFQQTMERIPFLQILVPQNLTGAKRREFEGMIHWLTINNNPSNPQQPIHSLRLARTSKLNSILMKINDYKSTIINHH